MVYTTHILVPKTRLKRGRPIGSKDKKSWMRKGAKMQNDLIEKGWNPKRFIWHN